jgi:hypothetical protein
MSLKFQKPAGSARQRRLAGPRRPALLGLVLLGLAGCAGAPPVADWQMRSHAAVQAHTKAYLSGQDRVAAHEQQLARREVARTGDASQMARVELHFCAVQAASLMFGECPGFAPLALDAGPAEQAYAAYLAGRWQGLDKAQLPAAQQAILTLSAGSTAHLQAMPSALSRLLAAAMLLRAGQLAPAGMELAIDTAAAEGWTRPLLAWLGADRDRLRAAGDSAAAEARQRQMDRVLSGLR